MKNRSPLSPTATPVIIAGAPRSGTTLLTTALNSHPQVMITNELRAWSLFNDLRRRTERPTELLPPHPLRDSFREAALQALTATFRDFYRTQVTLDLLGCPAESGTSVEGVIKAFGDKNPGYADTHSPGCLDYIAAAMPDARFIHIFRDPRSCVASYKSIAVYPDDITRCAEIWSRHTSSMIALREKIGPERVLEIRYESFVRAEGDDIFKTLERHIRVDNAQEPLDFLLRERERPIPYRSPSTPTPKLGQTTFEERLTAEEIEIVSHQCAHLARQLGYPID